MDADTTKAEEFTRAALANLGRDMPVTREIAHQGLAVQALLISLLGLPADARLEGLALLIALGDETAIAATRQLLDTAADSFVTQLREITARRAR